MSNNNNIAVYIDADNANSEDFLMVYNEIQKYGNIIIGRIYGDWTNNQIKTWKDVSINYSFQTMNCFNIAKKNSTDIYLICDLIDDLHKNNNIDIFVIVSSDSDFTEAARRIRTNGKKVFGIGKKKTHKMLKNSCDKFITNENLQQKKLGIDTSLLLKVFEENKVLSLKIFKTNFEKYENKKNMKKYFEFEDVIKVIENNVYYVQDVLDTIYDLFESSNKNILNIGYIKETLIRKDSTFDQRNYGFRSMKIFISKLFFKDFQIIIKENDVFIKKN